MPSSKSITHVDYAYLLTNYLGGNLCKRHLHNQLVGNEKIEFECALFASLNKIVRVQP